MTSFLKGIVLGLIIIGTIIISLRGFWWLFPLAIIVGSALGYLEKLITQGDKQQ
ncbi:MAG: hypothetical protein HZA63_09200 [Rhodocyclales bacterium]|nr:hypothetical protein [Rhodocyclales bacterium]